MKTTQVNFFYNKLYQILLTIVSASLFALALPNELFIDGFFLLGLIALIPFFIAVKFSSTYRFAGLLGVIFGLVNSLLTNFWLSFFADFAIWTLGGATLGYMVFLGIAAYFLRWAQNKSPRTRALYTALVWTVYEYFKCSGFLGYPWGLIAYPAQKILPFLQIAEITGVYGISFIMSFANTSLEEWILSRKDKTIPKLNTLALVLLVILNLCFGLIRMANPIPFTKTVSALLVQSNEDPWRVNDLEETILESILLNKGGLDKASLKNKFPDIVAWSESAIPYPILTYNELFESFPEEYPLFSLIRESETYFLLGTPIAGPNKGEWMNGAVFMSPDAEMIDTYAKMHPVPFAEYIPLWKYEMVRNFFKEVIGLSSGWVLGQNRTIFTLPLKNGDTTTFGVPICFEDAFPETCSTFIKNGADFLLNITNDSWSNTVSAEMQHHVVAMFRSIEAKRVMIRSTNGGFTSVIGPYGEIIASLEPFTADTLYYDIPVYKEADLTPYVYWGDLFIYLLLLFLDLSMIISFLKSRF